MTTPAILTSRLRTNGHCPPSLLSTQETRLDDSFLLKVSNLVQDGVKLRDNATVEEIKGCLELASNAAEIENAEEKGKVLAQRRAVFLAIIGATPPNSQALKGILNNGLLVTIKSWLDEILNLGLGGVDLLLHLLGSIAMLPVSKEMVTSSKLGKQVAAVEKHSICKGGMNEIAIKERVSKVKEEWSASVKRMKKVISPGTGSVAVPSKRSLDSSPASPISVKKSRPNETTKKSLSSYLSKVSGAEKEESAAEQTRKRAQEKAAQLRERLAMKRNQSNELSAPLEYAQDVDADADDAAKKGGKNVKWADMEGGPLTVSRGQENARGHDPNSWNDRKKNDRVREKELLEKARKSKLEDQDDSLDTMAMMYSTGWRQPRQLPPGDNPPVQADSNELNAQMRRIVATLPASFMSEADVPSNPTPLTDVEQALDLASQTTSIPERIPLFVAEPETITLAPISALPAVAPPMQTAFMPPVSALPSNIATFEFVQSLGLPPFLVGQNTEALKTLAAAPGLLSAFKDMHGNYDQSKILNLVHTLTSTIPGAAPPASVPPPPPQQFPPSGMPPYGQQYGFTAQTQQFQAPPPPPPQAASIYSAPGSFQTNNSNANSTDGNLHLSGFGPMTTPDMVIQLFSPYVKVDEVVPKSGFMFLNTSDPEGAHRAKEALTGVMVGGGPLRINPAVRRTKNQFPSNETASANRPPRTAAPAAPLPRDALGQIDYNSVCDDRGNPATRNLFVAGYGPGTTEQQIRETFSQFCQVTGIVMKNNFAFVNSSEKKSAVQAREALTGAQVNGGQLRINFAKESGRLGTTFDNNQPTQRSFAPPQQTNYYGRSF